MVMSLALTDLDIETFHRIRPSRPVLSCRGFR